MAATNPDRSSFFPAIEKKHGLPMDFWFDQMKQISDLKYAEQIAFLRETHGFSQAHANALVMFTRGSTTAHRHATPTDYFKTIDPQQARTMKGMFKVLRAAYPELKLVISWNQPILRTEKDYVFGASASSKYLLINPFSKSVIDAFTPKLKGYRVLKHTITIPNDWEIDEKLLVAMAKARIKEIR